ncbi:MAG: hypothetical protein MUC63_07280 [Planctomycetes bacterium]|jgi:hypothetical protein|nr:hypothetical protein [Planctomycetota bacterium]
MADAEGASLPPPHPPAGFPSPAPPGAVATPPGLPPAAAAGSSPRVPLEVLHEAQRRRRRRQRAVLAVSLGIVASVLAAAAAHWALENRFRSLYYGQPWIRIASVYRQIDQGIILAVHRDRTYRELEERYQGREVYAVGFVSRVLTPESPGAEAPAPAAGAAVEVLIDVPHFEEEMNLFDDEVRLEIPPSALEGIAVRELVMVRGTLKNYSRYGLWIAGASIRPLNSVERWYVRRALPPTRAVRGSYGFDRLREKKDAR